MPSTRNLKPSYQTGQFDDAAKANALLPIIEPAATRAPSSSALAINNALSLHASILSAGRSVTLPLSAKKAYVHVPIMPLAAGVELRAAGTAPVRLAPGDGAFVEGVEGDLEFVGAGEGAAATEFVVMSFPA